ncbi:MAG: FtsQ-type POTRA domain-containing protein [Firmicutes bacterium]|nr:FtsQ-type POTRA domain-containing protein [Bacillota bacterium]MCL2771363.1 FtsQ-type POTRA domain-containing protein [Bacillota bacterium]
MRTSVKNKLVICVSLFVIAAILVAGSTLFSLNQVRVNAGATPQFIFAGLTVNGQEITTNAQFNQFVVEQSGLEKGRNVLTLDTETAREMVERSVPRARVTSVMHVFPNHIEIRIQERAPRYFFERNGVFYVLDRDLKVIDNSATNRADLPLEIRNSKEVNFTTPPTSLLSRELPNQPLRNLTQAFFEFGFENEIVSDRFAMEVYGTRVIVRTGKTEIVFLDISQNVRHQVSQIVGFHAEENIPTRVAIDINGVINRNVGQV